LEHEWTGNVRELKNLVQRAYYLTQSELIDDVQFAGKQPKPMKVSAKPAESLKDIEKNTIEEALLINKGNAVKAAQSLNISKATIYRKIKSYSIDLHRI
jgi:transcriptional regulator with PAS, ATPase and Fis domain